MPEIELSHKQLHFIILYEQNAISTAEYHRTLSDHLAHNTISVHTVEESHHKIRRRDLMFEDAPDCCRLTVVNGDALCQALQDNNSIYK